MKEITARDELYEVAEVLREADEAEKDAKALKSEVRGPFLDLITEIVRDEVPLEKVTLEVTATELERYGGDVRAWAKVEHPTYNVVGIHTEDGENYKVSLEENETLAKFEFTYNGYKFGRTVSMVGASFDAKGMYHDIDKQNLSEDVQDALRAVIAVEVTRTYTLDESKAKQVMAEHPETVALFQQFASPGTPQVRLLPIKKTKDDE